MFFDAAIGSVNSKDQTSTPLLLRSYSSGMRWERYSASIQFAEIQDNKALFDSTLAIKSVDTAYASVCQIYAGNKVEEATAISSSYTAAERFRNNLQVNRASTKTYTHSAFATFQGKEAAEFSLESAAIEPLE